MAEIVNLRLARKRAARDHEAEAAADNRTAHGVSRSERDTAATARDKARHLLDGHQIEKDDRR